MHAPFGRDGPALAELARGQGADARIVVSPAEIAATAGQGFGAPALTEEARAALATGLRDRPCWSSAPVPALVSDPDRLPPGAKRSGPMRAC